MSIDQQARDAYATDPDPASLAAARIGVEHVEHHGRPLRFDGSTLNSDRTEHRFRCQDRSCPFRLSWAVHA